MPCTQNSIRHLFRRSQYQLLHDKESVMEFEMQGYHDMPPAKGSGTNFIVLECRLNGRCTVAVLIQSMRTGMEARIEYLCRTLLKSVRAAQCATITFNLRWVPISAVTYKSFPRPM